MDTPLSAPHGLTALPESLTIRSRHPSGAVTAVHVWESGWQIVELNNIADFERVKRIIDARNAGMICKTE